MSKTTTDVPPLPDIREVHPYSDNDRALFSELKSVLERHNAAGRFGVMLLHSHFPVATNEVLCEKTDIGARHQTIAPVLKSELSKQQHIVTSWRLDLDEPLMGCICVTINGHGHFTQN